MSAEVCGGSEDRPDLCDSAPILLNRHARHRRPVPCVECGHPRSIARWIPDARRDLEGRPLPGHVCLACDRTLSARDVARARAARHG